MRSSALNSASPSDLVRISGVAVVAGKRRRINRRCSDMNDSEARSRRKMRVLIIVGWPVAATAVPRAPRAWVAGMMGDD